MYHFWPAPSHKADICSCIYMQYKREAYACTNQTLYNKLFLSYVPLNIVKELINTPFMEGCSVHTTATCNRLVFILFFIPDIQYDRYNTISGRRPLIIQLSVVVCMVQEWGILCLHLRNTKGLQTGQNTDDGYYFRASILSLSQVEVPLFSMRLLSQ